MSQPDPMSQPATSAEPRPTPGEEPTEWEVVSRKRLLLGMYLDYLLLGVPFALLLWFAERALPLEVSLVLQENGGMLRIVLFLVLEAVFLRLINWSPGQTLLGVVQAPRLRAHQYSGPIDQAPPFLVNSQIRSQQPWWLLVIAVFFILDGAKVMVRWTQFRPPMPFFGVVPSVAFDGFASVVLGVIELALGSGVLLWKRYVAPLATLTYGTLIASSVVGFQQMGVWAGKYLLERREYQGLPVKTEDVELASQTMPTVAVVSYVVALLAALAAALYSSRVRKREEQ